MLSVLREHEKSRHRIMLTEYREHGTQGVVPGLFLTGHADGRDRPGSCPGMMSKLAASSPVFEPLMGVNSAESSSRSNIVPSMAIPSRLLPGWPAMLNCEVSNSRSPLLDLEVNMRRGPAGIRDRLDRPEPVLAGRARW